MSKRLIEVVAAVIENDGEYLLTQRKAAAVLPLLWEFPGGRVEDGESNTTALIRELSGRIGVTVLVGEQINENIHQYEGYDVRITLYSCNIPRGCCPKAVNVQQVRWVAACDLGNYEFPPADQESMSQLLNLLH